MSERDQLLKKIEGGANIEQNSDGLRVATTSSEVGQYNKANTNLNVALNNPQMNVNDNGAVNIINSPGSDTVNSMPISEIGLQTQVPVMQSSSSVVPTVDPVVQSSAPVVSTVNPVAQEVENETVNNRFINNPESVEGYQRPVEQGQIDNTRYVATYQSTSKKKGGSFKIKLSKETQLIFIIFLIIFVFILVLPNITDISKNIMSPSFWGEVGDFFKNLFKRG